MTERPGFWIVWPPSRPHAVPPYPVEIHHSEREAIEAAEDQARSTGRVAFAMQAVHRCGVAQIVTESVPGRAPQGARLPWWRR